MIENVLAKNKEERYSIEDLLKDKWFAADKLVIDKVHGIMGLLNGANEIEMVAARAYSDINDKENVPQSDHSGKVPPAPNCVEQSVLQQQNQPKQALLRRKSCFRCKDTFTEESSLFCHLKTVHGIVLIDQNQNWKENFLVS